jgi:hypothetical protein
MKRTIAIVMGVLVLGVLALAEDKNTHDAEKAAQLWLQLVDKGDYAMSYDESSSFFKSAVTKDQWEKALTASRGSFGKLLSRKLKGAEFKTSLPGAPDGKYVVIQYEASFEKKKEAIETVTPMLDKDGQWRVSGYFVR